MPSLTRDEAVARADLLTVSLMEVELDLDRGAQTFGSVTRIHLTASGDGQTFVDVKPAWGGMAHGLDPRTAADNS